MRTQDLSVAVKCIVAFVLAALFALAFYVRYWKWRECIAVVKSSCTEPGAGNATAGGMIWALPAIAFLVWGALLLWRVFAAARRPEQDSPSTRRAGRGA